jgi:NifU-like protein involved in Fe-S cluster formation
LDEILVKYYRGLLKSGFEHAGSLENPSIFLNSVEENVPVCSTAARRFIHLFIIVKENIIDDIKDLCLCDPTANVAVEILCLLVKGKTIEVVKDISAGDFLRVLGGENDALRKAAEGLLEILHRGLERYRTGKDLTPKTK